MPDQYGNPTEEDYRLYGYAPPGVSRGPSTPINSFNSTGTGYSPDVQAAVNARRDSGMSTLDVYNGDQLVSHEERVTPQRDNSANAPNYQSAFPELNPGLANGATNRDVLGGGKFGVRGWLNQHPVGAIAAALALAAGGAAAMPAAGGAAAGGITGGAGTGFLGSLGGGSGLLSQSSIRNAGRLNGLLGGDSGGTAEVPYTGMGMGQSQAMPQGMMGSNPIQKPILPGMPASLPTAQGRRPYKFQGTTIWM
jgi:hypothetical protein